MSRFSLKQLKSVVIAGHIVRNVQSRIRAAAGGSGASVGATHLGLDLQASLAYIRRVYDEYLKFGGLTEADLVGKRVLEIGPGDNLGVPLLFLAAGAAHATGLDKFYSHRDAAQQKRIYEALRSELSEGQRARFDRAIRLEPEPDFVREYLRYSYGVGIEEAEQRLAGERFDLIVSRVALQDVVLFEATFRVMDRLLSPGGLMVHKIDLRDYGLFPRTLYHPLTFLTVSDPVYGMMTSHRGLPNRHRMGDYRRMLEGLGYKVSFMVTGLLGVRGELASPRPVVTPGVDYGEETQRLIAQIRPRLLPRFRELAEEELAVEGFFAIARKPQ